MSAVLAGQLAVAAIAGSALGVAYFALLLQAARRFADGATGPRTLGLLLLRGALAVAGFWSLAQFGAACLVAGLGGFLVARLGVQLLAESG